MAQSTNISWTDATWNIARGCTKVDEDCKFCYMYRDSLNNSRYNPLEIVRTKKAFSMPLNYKETKSACWDGRPLIFTCSLTDFFHEGVDSYRDEAWDIIRKCPHLIFQILTKRPERIMSCMPEDIRMHSNNVWIGTSAGSDKAMSRIVELAMLETNCLKFLSLEPLHGPINLGSEWVNIVHPDNEGDGVEAVKGFDWVIVGGESGNEIGKYRYRPCNLEWIENIVEACDDACIPVFVKQMGTYLSKELGMERHGGNIEQFPKHLQVRQFPSLKWKFTGDYSFQD